jgi:prepilin-type processing-associated H-X9-DG protein
MPAVLRVKEASQRMECATHLKQLGIAVHSYHDIHQKLPPIRLDNVGAVSWGVLLLPYVEQQAFYQQWDLYTPYYLHDSSVQMNPVKLYQCPSMTYFPQVAQTTVIGHQRPNPPGAVTGYAVCAGDNPNSYSTTAADGAFVLANFQLDKTGVLLGWNSRTSFVNITDGLSNTLFMGDKYVPFGDSVQFKYGDSSAYNGDRANAISRVAGPSNPIARTTTDLFNLQFGSRHPGVCNFLFGDGSVRPLSPDTKGAVLGLLANRSDGQPIPGF